MGALECGLAGARRVSRAFEFPVHVIRGSHRFDNSLEVLVARSVATGSLRFTDLAFAIFALLNFLSGCGGGSSYSTQSVNPTTYILSGTISPSSGGSGATLTLSGRAAGSTTADGAGNYSFTGLTNGTYVVTPTRSGYSFNPSDQTVTINSGNATGVDFSATQQASSSVALSWIASASAVSGYNVYRGTINGGPYTKINSSLVTALTYVDSSVSSGTTYYYVSTSVDSDGIESIYSNQVTAQIP